MTTINHRTPSGVNLAFEAHPHQSSWNHVGGVYAFAHTSAAGWQVHYVGQTNSFANRIPNHETWPSARRLGATHVLVTVITSAPMRDQVERELIRQWQPPLNTLLK